MAITKTWDVAKPAGSDNVSIGDDQIRDDKTAYVERGENGGHYVPATADAKAGLHYPSDTQVANPGEFIVYDNAAGVPDTSIKRLRIVKGASGDTEIKSGASGSIKLLNNTAVTGTLTRNGLNVLATDAQKRLLVCSISGNFNQSGTDIPLIRNNTVVIPNSLGVAQGTIIEFGAIASAVFPNGAVIGLLKAPAASWSSNKLTAAPRTLGSLLAALTISDGTTVGRRTFTISSATVSGGDILCFDTSGFSSGLDGIVYVVIEVNWS